MDNNLKRKYTISVKYIYLYMLMIYLLISFLYVIFIQIWGDSCLNLKFRCLFLIFLFIGIIIHELIHALFAAVFSPNGFKNIKIGFNFKSFVFYCNLKEPLRVKHFKIVAIMPFILLGLLPVIISFIYGYRILLDISLMLSAGSIADLILIYWLRKEPNDYWVEEISEPKKLGIIVYKTKPCKQ